MVIAPKCDKCGNELVDYGALLFSPPDSSSTTKKFHICKKCYNEYEEQLVSS